MADFTWMRRLPLPWEKKMGSIIEYFLPSFSAFARHAEVLACWRNRPFDGHWAEWFMQGYCLWSFEYLAVDFSIMLPWRFSWLSLWWFLKLEGYVTDACRETWRESSPNRSNRHIVWILEESFAGQEIDAWQRKDLKLLINYIYSGEVFWLHTANASYSCVYTVPD